MQISRRLALPVGICAIAVGLLSYAALSVPELQLANEALRLSTSTTEAVSFSPKSDEVHEIDISIPGSCARSSTYDPLAGPEVIPVDLAWSLTQGAVAVTSGSPSHLKMVGLGSGGERFARLIAFKPVAGANYRMVVSVVGAEPPFANCDAALKVSVEGHVGEKLLFSWLFRVILALACTFAAIFVVRSAVARARSARQAPN